MSTVISRKQLKFWLGAAAIIALALGVSANRSAEAVAVQASLQRARAADQARWEGMARVYSAVDVLVSGPRFDTEPMPGALVQPGARFDTEQLPANPAHPGARFDTEQMPGVSPSSEVLGMPQPGLYRLYSVSAATSAARGMPQPGLYRLYPVSAATSAARGMPQPGLYRLLIS